MWHYIYRNKIKAEVSKANKIIFLLLKARKIINATVTVSSKNKYLVDCGKPMFSLLVTSIKAKTGWTKHILNSK